MARLNNEQLRERVFEDRAHLCYYTNDDGKVEFSLQNTRSSLAFPDDLKLTKKQYEYALDELLLDGRYIHSEIWKGYGTYKFNPFVER